MSLIPAFKIGLCNAWVLTIYLPLHPLIMMLIVKDVRKKMESPAHKKANTIFLILRNFLLFFGLFMYSFFLPLQSGTIWFYVGLTICLSGWITWTIAMVNIADIPLGKPWTTGLYRYSRHPMVLSSFFVLIGTGIAAASWLFLLLSIVFIVLTNIYVADEEQFCLEKYGTSYHEYISRTPRWLGKPKSGKD